MLKKEWVYREILYQLENKKNFFTQKNLAAVCSTSMGNVNKAIKPFVHMNAIDKKHLGFNVVDPRKILFYWASFRQLERDIVYQTVVDMPVREIEEMMPSCLFTAYSGYKFRFHSAPAGYSEVFAYVNNEHMEKVLKRFPKNKKSPNLIVLAMDDHLKKFKTIPLAQLFVDLWNINTWYAKEFLNELEGVMHGILE